MAALPDPDRIACMADFCRERSAIRDILSGLVKADLRAAVNAIDDWIDANTAAFNAALPQPARGALTASQKQELFLRVLHRRVKGN